MSEDPPRALCERITSAPLPGGDTLTDTRVDDLRAELHASARLGRHLDHPATAALLRGIAAGSPFLWGLIRSDPRRCAALLDANPEAAADRVIAELRASLADPALTTLAGTRVLRLARQEMALLVALADLGGVWRLDAVTEALTRFAEAAVAGALALAVRDMVRAGRFRQGTAAANCGLSVLALGKAGGRELNYSSDIDLVVLFDPQAAALTEGTQAAPVFVKLTQVLVRLLQERTADGVVLRVDLRLRPDPASTAVAIAVPAAFHYYEALGQNWERAAFIKARPIAGDLALGAAFLRDLAPFIWRKYFDYAAIADIHAMKRQIHAVRGQASVAVAGHDVKLGRGGIREIEFFVQTQQLIFGGRRSALRGAATCAMLAALAADRWIEATVRDELTAAYGFLRTVEHRLQMVNDQQTQRVPSDPSDLARFARFCGFADTPAFSVALLGHLHIVTRHYAQLFEHAPGLDLPEGSLVFTGTEADPATLATLRTLGFKRPEQVAELVRGWHFGRRPAVRSPRAREVLTDLVPALLLSFSRAGDADGALATFDTVLSRITSAVELLSLLRSNAALRDLFADLLGSAPSLAATVAFRPHVLDAAIDPGLIDGPGAGAPARIEAALARAGTTEDFLDRMRDTAAEELFTVGLHTLAHAVEAEDAARRRSDIAEALIRAALARCRLEFETQHGRLPGGACVVLGMGKLGSRELSAASDLDLIVVYRSDPEFAESDGPRPLDPARYYARLTQRLIMYLTTPTRRGRLYEVDVRLRPSGRQGPLATRFAAFAAYQEREAQTWEHMALTRGRVIAGDRDLAREVEATISHVLRAPRALSQLNREVGSMRTLVAREKPAKGAWDMKLSPGGLLDIEFVAQCLQLAHAHRHPTLCSQHPVPVLAEAARLALVSPAQASTLTAAYHLQSAALQMLRLMLGDSVTAEDLGSAGARRLCQALDQPDLDHLEAHLAALRVDVRACFDVIINPEGGMDRDDPQDQLRMCEQDGPPSSREIPTTGW